jgi:hypothetical protein
MEIRKYFDIGGAVTAQAIVEGRMGLKVANSLTHDFGSWSHLPGVRVPATSAEATRARYLVAFPVTNAKPPIYQSYPSFSYALRQGFDQTENVPFDATIYHTPPNLKEGQTIPSGSLALLFGPGVYSVPSGAFVYSSDVETPGVFLTVANVADDGATDAGKLKYSATETALQVEEYESSSGKLTFRIRS